MGVVYPESQCARLGVVIRRSPGVTPWAKWSWRATAVLPGAGAASWKLLREDAGVSEYHASTHDLWLYVSDSEAYAHELQAASPSVYVILRDVEAPADGEMPLHVLTVTASPYEAQDYSDSGEEIVERVPMPPAVLEWVTRFVDEHHRETPFVKRRRDKLRTDQVQSGIGDARIAQLSDVYRAPTAARTEPPE
ncbi:DUF3305 domain-containing protein [Roseobacter sinensis]|uniref:DUF3305 domain-containing protein n=1 Tax=Roseobacter sinensis TaxID=2931391 RepID=A0ABT3BHS7_9RHOB|nr:DUF3305 domain-containing protein [Roseobacter sp. WL0113]MCV3273095.1 DUF3305 domain-containing protein [Roseobacter sp. WL0113]